MRMLVATVVTCLAVAGFIWTASPSPGEGSSSEERSGQEVPSELAPQEFRTLRTNPLDDAVPLVADILHGGGSAILRDDLAEIYESAGFYGAARFWHNTAQLVRRNSLDSSVVESPIAWSAADRVLSDRSQEVARGVSTLASDGAFDQAIALARANIEAFGPSSQVVVEWADAVLWKVIEDKTEVSDDALEVALRLYLTAVEEPVSRPRSMLSKASGYSRLSNVFEAAGDIASSVTAALLALLGEDSASPSGSLSGFEKEELCSRIENASRRLDLSKAARGVFTAGCT